jgi:spore coat protein SA
MSDEPLEPRNHHRASVAVLLSSGERFGPYFGGALARWTYEVYRCLTGQIEVEVFGFPTAPGDQYPLPHQTSGVWRACEVMARVPLLRRYEEELWLRALFSRLRSFDLIHIHNRPQWIPLLRRFGYKGYLLLHLQNDHLGHWKADMLDALAPQLQGVAVCSTYLRNTFATKSAAMAAKTRVVFNGVNTGIFHPREELREPRTIFFVGRFDPEKGVLQLVQAFAHVLQDHPDARLVIGGTTGFGTHKETQYVREVRSKASLLDSQHPGCVQFPGYIHHDNDLPACFQRATIFASPSLFQEPFGLVNAEAMACATPVVGSGRGGIPEVVGDTGVLANPEDTQEFASALSTLLAQPERRARLGRASMQRARSLFDWQVIGEVWAKFLGEVLSSSA